MKKPKQSKIPEFQLPEWDCVVDEFWRIKVTTKKKKK
jgi:hypothetical protein